MLDVKQNIKNNILPLLFILGLAATSLIYHVLTHLTNPFSHYDAWAFTYPLFKNNTTTWEIIACIISWSIVFIITALISGRWNKKVYGDARFATDYELKKLGLFKRSGIFLGRYGNRVLGKMVIFDDNESVMVTMPTGLGKTSGVVIPTLLTYPGSIICTDIKGELAAQTAGFRAQFSKVYIFRFNGKPTNRINLLDYIRWDTPFQTRDMDRLAAAFFPPTNEYFEDAPRDLFVALIGVAYALPDMPTTLKTVWMLLNPEVFKRNTAGEFVQPTDQDNEKNIISLYFMQLIDYAPNINSSTKSLLKRFAHIPFKQLQGVVDTLNKKLTPFRDELIDAATCATDIPFEHSRRRRMTIYLQFSVNEYKRYAPIIRVLYEFIQDYLMEELPQDDEPHRVLFLKDEFANLGKLKDYAKFISLSRQYQIQTMIIIQSIAQLYQTYQKETNTLVSAFKKQFYSVVNDEETARIISNRAGTRSADTISYSGDLFEGGKSRQSQSLVSEQLVKPYQAYLLDKDKGLLFSEAGRPAKINIVKSWKNPVFKKRLQASRAAGFHVRASKPQDYTAINKYPCIIDDQLTAIENTAMPEELDLSEYADILDNDH